MVLNEQFKMSVWRCLSQLQSIISEREASLAVAFIDYIVRCILCVDIELLYTGNLMNFDVFDE